MSGATKRFGQVRALRNLSLDIPLGRVTVMVGPNGAGKTTAIRLLTGVLAPDRGSVVTFGADPTGPEGSGIRRRCGVVTAKPSLYDRLDGAANLRYAAELYGLGRNPATDAHIESTAARFGIAQALGQRVGGYSTGMKTRLALARAVLHDPELLLLDEPTSGLDPESARSVLGLIRSMTDRHRSVLLCTHLLPEAEGLADEVVMVQDGTSLLWGDPSVLARRYWPHPRVAITSPDPARLAVLARYPEVVAVEEPTARNPGHHLVASVRSEHEVPAVVARLAADGVPVAAVVPQVPTLEELYFAVRREMGRRGDGTGERSADETPLGGPAGPGELR